MLECRTADSERCRREDKSSSCCSKDTEKFVFYSLRARRLVPHRGNGQRFDGRVLDDLGFVWETVGAPRSSDGVRFH